MRDVYGLDHEIKEFKEKWDDEIREFEREPDRRYEEAKQRLEESRDDAIQKVKYLCFAAWVFSTAITSIIYYLWVG